MMNTRLTEFNFGPRPAPSAGEGVVRPYAGCRFQLLRRSDLSPVNAQRIALADGAIVPCAQIAIGYEYAKGMYAVLAAEDLRSHDQGKPHVPVACPVDWRRAPGAGRNPRASIRSSVARRGMLRDVQTWDAPLASFRPIDPRGKQGFDGTAAHGKRARSPGDDGPLHPTRRSTRIRSRPTRVSKATSGT